MKILFSIRDESNKLYKSRKEEGYLIRNHLNADDKKICEWLNFCVILK